MKTTTPIEGRKARRGQWAWISKAGSKSATLRHTKPGTAKPKNKKALRRIIKTVRREQRNQLELARPKIGLHIAEILRGTVKEPT